MTTFPIIEIMGYRVALFQGSRPGINVILLDGSGASVAGFWFRDPRDMHPTSYSDGYFNAFMRRSDYPAVIDLLRDDERRTFITASADASGESASNCRMIVISRAKGDAVPGPG